MNKDLLRKFQIKQITFYQISLQFKNKIILSIYQYIYIKILFYPQLTERIYLGFVIKKIQSDRCQRTN